MMVFLCKFFDSFNTLGIFQLVAFFSYVKGQHKQFNCKGLSTTLQNMDCSSACTFMTQLLRLIFICHEGEYNAGFLSAGDNMPS